MCEPEVMTDDAALLVRLVDQLLACPAVSLPGPVGSAPGCCWRSPSG